MTELKFKIRENYCMVKGKTPEYAAKMFEDVVKQSIGAFWYSRVNPLIDEKIVVLPIGDNYRNN